MEDQQRMKLRWRRERSQRLRPRFRRPMRPHRRMVFGPLPTLLTLGNGVCGLGAITAATGALRAVPLPPNDALFVAGLLVFLGMLFDMLDGQAARLMKQSTAFGAQLDSLCDVITFGVAPVFIVLMFDEVFHPRLIFGVGAVYMACVLMRLARFNVETSDDDPHDYFSGLPSPAAAGTIASVAIATPGLHQLADPSMPRVARIVASAGIEMSMVAVPALMLLLACLMVSRVKYPHVVNQWIRRKYAFYDLSRGILVVMAAMTVHELALPLLFCFFAFEPPVRSVWRKFVTPRELPPKELASP